MFEEFRLSEVTNFLLLFLRNFDPRVVFYLAKVFASASVSETSGIAHADVREDSIGYYLIVSTNFSLVSAKKIKVVEFACTKLSEISGENSSCTLALDTSRIQKKSRPFLFPQRITIAAYGIDNCF